MKALIRLYPKRWRERYGAEFAALLETQPPTPRIVLDVLRGALDARMRSARGTTGWGGVFMGLLAFVAAQSVLSVVHRMFRGMFGTSIPLETAYQVAYWALVLASIVWLSRQPATRREVENAMRRIRGR